MKYALWRMLTRVGRVLSLRVRHALNAALKSGGKQVENAEAAPGGWAMLGVGGQGARDSTFGDDAELEGHHIAQQLSPGRRVKKNKKKPGQRRTSTPTRWGVTARGCAAAPLVEPQLHGYAQLGGVMLLPALKRDDALHVHLPAAYAAPRRRDLGCCGGFGGGGLRVDGVERANGCRQVRDAAGGGGGEGCSGLGKGV
jgi:hypothetical protein